MLNLVLFGPPGAGKGTQSAKLVQHYQLVHLSTGDIFRYNIKNQTELGKLAKQYMDAGNLVPDEVTISMLEAEVNMHPNAKGFIFDGFPRTEAQADALEKFLNDKGTGISLMLALEVNEQELVNRLLLRGKESQRADDQDESIIRNRIAVYEKQTAILADYYQKRDKFKGVNGIGEVEEIFSKLCQEIDRVNQA